MYPLLFLIHRLSHTLVMLFPLFLLLRSSLLPKERVSGLQAAVDDRRSQVQASRHRKAPTAQAAGGMDAGEAAQAGRGRGGVGLGRRWGEVRDCRLSVPLEVPARGCAPECGSPPSGAARVLPERPQGRSGSLQVETLSFNDAQKRLARLPSLVVDCFPGPTGNW